MKERKLTNAILLHEKDNVVTTVTELNQGELISFVKAGNVLCYKICQNIPVFHKIAIQIIKKGMPIYKYGEVIGWATQDIMIGEHVHTHNLSSEKGMIL